MSDKPDQMSEADLLRYQLAEARVANAAMAMQLAKTQRDALHADLSARYSIAPGDNVAENGAIARSATPVT